jgi:Fe2+ transport system protein FeoA
MTLADLRAGAHVAIVAIDTHDPAVQRLMTLGLVEGIEVEFMQASLGGDPLEIRVNGAAISLRREQARAFSVEPVNS